MEQELELEKEQEQEHFEDWVQAAESVVELAPESSGRVQGWGLPQQQQAPWWLRPQQPPAWPFSAKQLSKSTSLEDVEERGPVFPYPFP